MRRLVLLLTCLAVAAAASAVPPVPAVSRVFPLVGQRGAQVELEILGEYLSNTISVEFDCEDVVWTGASYTSSAKLVGKVAIAPDAPLGLHLLRVRTLEGYSNSALFSVGQFRTVLEAEPNDVLADSQAALRAPVAVQGVLEGSADIDFFAIGARAGQRLTIDLRSIEHGSAVEAKMFLLDREGRRVAFNDDRDDYLETPFIEHTFESDGIFHVKIDQYRGPRGFNFGKNSAYTLRITSLPTVSYTSPLGAEVGSSAKISIHGSGLASVNSVSLTPVRGAEYARMTYPYTMPVRFGPDPARADLVPRLEGKVVRRVDSEVIAEFTIPDDAPTGLWRVWVGSPAGIADGPSIELGRLSEFTEATAADADWRPGGYVINGALSEPGEQDVHAIHTVAGQPLHFWTLATQLGVPHLDPVLTLRDSAGRRIAENDDVVAGQGSLLGNPDSSLFYTPEQDEVLFLVIKDRTLRGGPSYQYRLKVQSGRPGFQLFTTPENFTVPRGGEAEIKVHLVREEDFGGEVSVWFDSMPGGVEAPRGKFRADQLFVPNADGADMIIPEIPFLIRVPESVPAGRYPIRIFATPTPEELSPDRRVEQARATLMMGPLLDLWNFVRRPLPSVEMTVVEPTKERLSSPARTVEIARDGHASIELSAENLPKSAEVHVKGLPEGVSFEAQRQDSRVEIALSASSSAPVGSFDISAEAMVEERWIPTNVIVLKVAPESEANLSN